MKVNHSLKANMEVLAEFFFGLAASLPEYFNLVVSLGEIHQILFVVLPVLRQALTVHSAGRF